MVEIVLSAFRDWYVTLWDTIDVDQLLERCKTLNKEVKTLNRAVRLYDVYKYAPHQRSHISKDHHFFSVHMCIAGISK